MLSGRLSGVLVLSVGVGWDGMKLGRRGGRRRKKREVDEKEEGGGRGRRRERKRKWQEKVSIALSIPSLSICCCLVHISGPVDGGDFLLVHCGASWRVISRSNWIALSMRDRAKLNIRP